MKENAYPRKHHPEMQTLEDRNKHHRLGHSANVGCILPDLVALPDNRKCSYRNPTFLLEEGLTHLCKVIKVSYKS